MLSESRTQTELNIEFDVVKKPIKDLNKILRPPVCKGWSNTPDKQK
jgi:hypothetical protein